jgi:hypothetical protein
MACVEPFSWPEVPAPETATATAVRNLLFPARIPDRISPSLSSSPGRRVFLNTEAITEPLILASLAEARCYSEGLWLTGQSAPQPIESALGRSS